MKHVFIKVEDLESEADRLHVKLDINPALKDIHIWGLRTAVQRVSELVSKKLKDIDKKLKGEEDMRRDQMEEQRLAKHVQWRYHNEMDSSWTEFDPHTNKVRYIFFAVITQ